MPQTSTGTNDVSTAQDVLKTSAILLWLIFLEGHHARIASEAALNATPQRPRREGRAAITVLALTEPGIWVVLEVTPETKGLGRLVLLLRNLSKGWESSKAAKGVPYLRN